MFGRNLQQVRRYRHIVGVLVKYGFEEAADSVRERFPVRLSKMFGRRPTKASIRSRPERVRMALEEMGPMFIKLGQLLSTRPDLVPPKYINELERLQDRVPPESSDTIVSEVEKELGGKLGDLFANFDKEALAAGSIAQVHRAVTLQGDQVVVKVRRPQIVETIRVETRILHDLAGLLRATLFEDETINPQRMVDEFADAVHKEADLSNEKRNQLRFIHYYNDDPAIHVPRIYENYCTDGVLTMEYIDGIRPRNAALIREQGLDPKKIAARGAHFALGQIFEFGFFHTDPHPGNFFLLKDNVLAPIDFGQVGRLSSSDIDLLHEIVISIVSNDAGSMMRGLEQAQMMSSHTDPDKLRRDIENMLAAYYGLPLKDLPFNQMILEMFDLIRHNHIRPPAQFPLMLKTMMNIYNFDTELYNYFNIIDYLKPYARRYQFKDIDPKVLLRNFRRGVKDAGGLVSKLPDDVNNILSKFRTGKFQMRIHHEHLENLAYTLDKSSNRISFALIIAALLVGSSMLVPQDGSVLGLITYQKLGMVGYLVAAILGIGLLVSIIRSRHL